MILHFHNSPILQLFLEASVRPLPPFISATGNNVFLYHNWYDKGCLKRWKYISLKKLLALINDQQTNAQGGQRKLNKISSADSLLSMIKNLANNKLSPSTPSSPQVTIALIIVTMMWATMEVMAMKAMVKVKV